MDGGTNVPGKRKYGRWRAYSLIAVYLLIGLHIAHWKLSGSTLAPLELNEVLYTIHLGIITAGFIFMAVTMAGTVLFGRFFCSWACHILALQDLSAWILAKLKIKPGNIRSRAFLLVPVVAMFYLFVWPQVERLVAGRDFAGFRILSDSQGWASFMTNDFWRNLPGIPITLFTFFVCGFTIIYFLGSRSFCQKACPYGVLFSFADKFAPGKIKLTGNCIQCGTCTAHCSSHILVHKEIAQFGKVVNSDCLKDLDCVSVCPENAISYGFTKPSLLDSFKKLKDHNAGYSFTKAEDAGLALLTFIYVVIFRGLYDLIPFLLAITLAVIFAYFTVILFRVFRRDHVLFGKYVLRRNRRLTVTGRFYAALVIILILFSIHSGYVHYHQYRGNTYYEKALSEQKLSPGNSHTEKALFHLLKASGWGLITPLSLNRQLAAIYLGKKDYSLAEKYLSGMLKDDPGDTEARLRYAKLMFVSGRESECVNALKFILNADSAQLTLHEKKTRAEAHLTIGHIEEKNGFPSTALGHYQRALAYDPSNPESLLALGVIYTRAGKYGPAERYLLSFVASDPASPVAHNNLSMIYLKINMSEKAIHHLQQLVALQPENATAHYNLGMLYYKAGDQATAEAELERALLIAPGYGKAHAGIANLLEKRGDLPGAEKHRKIAAQLELLAGTNGN